MKLQKKQSQPNSRTPAKCHLHSDAERGTDTVARQGDTLADGNVCWDRASEKAEILHPAATHTALRAVALPAGTSAGKWG